MSQGPKAAVFLFSGFVSAQLQGFSNLRLRQSLARKSEPDWPTKSSLLIATSFLSML
jgi:hypothetical protein